MKNILVTIAFCLSMSISIAQDLSIEKSTFGIQTGVVGIWIYNEAKLTNFLALRTEFGLSSGFGKDYFYLAPGISIEPKWYYNLKKRNNDGKNTSFNSGNFISIYTVFAPDWFIISNSDAISIYNQIAIIPTWGIRRNIGKHFNYEIGAGVGYRHIFKNSNYAENEGESAVNLHLRIGYKF